MRYESFPKKFDFKTYENMVELITNNENTKPPTPEPELVNAELILDTIERKFEKKYLLKEKFEEFKELQKNYNEAHSELTRVINELNKLFRM